LDPRIVSKYFINYAENSKGYKFYYPSNTLRIVRVRNIKFIENNDTKGSYISWKIQCEKTRDQDNTLVNKDTLVIPKVYQTPSILEEQLIQELPSYKEQVIIEPKFNTHKL
jgi:hypothetical protein